VKLARDAVRGNPYRPGTFDSIGPAEVIVRADSMASTGLRLVVLLSVVLSFWVSPSGAASSLGYDAAGRLASVASPYSAVSYTYDDAGNRATSGSTTSTYTWDEAAALPSLLSDGTSGYLSADTTLLAETSASANAYPLTDALGSVRAQTDGTGSIILPTRPSTGDTGQHEMIRV
jgi:YD repeat-containing protein